MKKLFLIICAAGLLAACEKDPDLDKLDSSYTVYTDYDKEADFAKFATYFMPDSILEGSDGSHAQYWKDENAQSILAEVAANLSERGYERIVDAGRKGEADFGVQVSFISQSTTVVSGGYYDPWWDYGFWGPWWSGWYYPYPVTAYDYNTGTLIMEMLDLTRSDEETGKRHKLPVVWYADANGFIYGNMRANMRLIMEAVDQAFAQSPYINKK